MFSNLTGWHVIIIGVLVLVIVAVIVVAVLIARRSRNVAATPGYPQTSGPTGSTPDASTRLAQLTELRDRGQITDAEYDARRRQIVDGL